MSIDEMERLEAELAALEAQLADRRAEVGRLRAGMDRPRAPGRRRRLGAFTRGLIAGLLVGAPVVTLVLRAVLP